MAPRALALTGHGINCDEDTRYAFERVGIAMDIVHVNDLIDGRATFDQYHILAFPGGFSYGDDTGSGNALANQIRNHLWNDLERFLARDTLTIGICNGFQVLVNLGLLPASNNTYGEREVALVHNDTARYATRWVDIAFDAASPWTQGLGTLSIPIAHGEGKLYAPPTTLAHIKERGLIAGRYVHGKACAYQALTPNPNGSLDDIAALCDPTGRVLGMMPHPERAITFTHQPWWPVEKETLRRAGRPLPTEGDGLKLFANAAKYFNK